MRLGQSCCRSSGESWHCRHMRLKSVLLRRSNVPTAFTGYSFHVIEAAIVFANEILVCFLFPIHIGVHRVYHLFTTVIHNGEQRVSHLLPCHPAPLHGQHPYDGWCCAAPHCLPDVGRVTLGQGMLAPLSGMLQFLQCLAVGTGLTALLATAGGHAGYEMAPFIPSLEAVIVALLRSVHPAAKQLSGALNTVQHHDLHHRFPTRHFSLYFTHWDRWCGTEHPAYCEQVGTYL